MNVLSWLESVTNSITDAESQHLRLPIESRKRKRQVRRQMPTPDRDATPPPGNKRRRPDSDDNDGPIDPDTDRTPRGRALLSKSNSDRAGSRSSGTSGTSRSSATTRLGHLEIAPVNPVIVTQISRSDVRMPTELIAMLDTLDGFQSRVGIVPDYLAAEIEARAKYDRELYNFQPLRFQPLASIEPKLSLGRILEAFSAAKECFNEGHSEATWNALVHWPIFQLALGPITEVAEAAVDQSHDQKRQVRVRAMPCTAARLPGRAHGAKMVDYCIFVEPQGDDAEQVDAIRSAQKYINQTDYPPLRRRPIVLSAESKEPSEGYEHAQIHLGVWQASQWALFERTIASRPTQTAQTQTALIPFLPALIIQGHEWSFAATTKSGRHTILWVKQGIGGTDTVLGVFQIIHALRHLAAWIRETYWPWYRRVILEL